MSVKAIHQNFPLSKNFMLCVTLHSWPATGSLCVSKCSISMEKSTAIFRTSTSAHFAIHTKLAIAIHTRKFSYILALYKNLVYKIVV